jgi:hypothetical protein
MHIDHSLTLVSAVHSIFFNSLSSRLHPSGCRKVERHLRSGTGRAGLRGAAWTYTTKFSVQRASLDATWNKAEKMGEKWGGNFAADGK